jgi:hypothetical protein
MSENPTKLRVVNQNTTFPAFFFAVYGTVLLGTAALSAGIGIYAQPFIALLFLFLAAGEYLRYRRTLSLTVSAKESEAHRSTKIFTIRNAGWFILMLTLGTIFGQLVLVGYVTPMLIFVIGLQFLPWSCACACPRDFYTSSLLIAVGAAYPLLLAAGPIGTPMDLLIAGWVLWVGAVFAYLRRL